MRVTFGPPESDGPHTAAKDTRREVAWAWLRHLQRAAIHWPLPPVGSMAPLTCETLARCVTLISFVATCTVAVVYLTLHHASVDEVFDFVVVGGGSTGSVVAGRLGMAGYSVLLLEAGGATQRSLQPPGQGDSGSASRWTVFDVPLGWLQVLSDHRWSKEFQWVVPADPPPAIARGLGGCGIHNAMLYMRGMPEDFEHWGDGWRWEDVLPFYLRSENNSVHAPATSPLRSSSQPHPHSTHCRQRLLSLEQVHRDSPHHGNSGPVQISSVEPDVISAAFVAASVAAGQPQNDDFNGASREGAGLYQFMIRDGSPRTSGSNRRARQSSAGCAAGSRARGAVRRASPRLARRGLPGAACAAAQRQGAAARACDARALRRGRRPRDGRRVRARPQPDARVAAAEGARHHLRPSSG